MDMKGLCSNTYPQGENLLLLSVTGGVAVQQCQLSEIRENKSTLLVQNYFMTH